MKQRFHYGLNGLRGLACIVVLVFHCCLVFRCYGADHTDKMPLSISGFQGDLIHFALALFNGPACVTLFFVLSGVVLSLSLDVDGDLSGKTVVSYWAKRLSRLYPLLIMATIFSEALQVLLFRHHQFRAGTTWLNWAYDVNLTPKELLKNLVGASPSLNSPAWSIKVEIIESAIFPVIYMLSRRAIPAVIAFVVLLALMLTAHGNGSTLDDLRVFTVCFLAGALIPRWSAPVAHAFARLPSIARLTAVAATIAVFCCSRWVNNPMALQTFLVMATATFLIIVVYHRPAGTIAKSFIARKLGEISYSVYLLHMPILTTVAFVWLSLEQNPAEIPWVSGTIVLTVLTLLVTLPIAYLSYTYFERPVEGAGRRLAKQLNPRVSGPRLVTTN
jgi:peptidoglycan/LPS O-acetylase OafA/YrhL